ncbi:MAG: hypothetical protein WAM42_14545 [Candidatus Nitrosopolaris sp.]
MNKNTSVTMAAAIAVAGILTLAVLAVAIQHQAFAGSSNPCCDNNNNKCCDNNNKQPSKEVATGGNGGSGGAGGAGGEGGQGGKNVAEENQKAKVDQDANGGYANGGHGGNANGGNATA